MKRISIEKSPTKHKDTDKHKGICLGGMSLTGTNRKRQFPQFDKIRPEVENVNCWLLNNGGCWLLDNGGAWLLP